MFTFIVFLFETCFPQQEGATWKMIVNISTGTDVEHWAFEARGGGDLTKMALARALQVRDGLSDAQRIRVLGLAKDILYAALGDAVGPGAVGVAKAAAKAGPMPAALLAILPKAAAPKAKAAGKAAPAAAVKAAGKAAALPPKAKAAGKAPAAKAKHVGAGKAKPKGAAKAKGA